MTLYILLHLCAAVVVLGICAKVDKLITGENVAFCAYDIFRTGYTLFYPDGIMDLNYFSYTKTWCIENIENGYGEYWPALRKRGFSVRKIIAREAKK